MNSNRIEKIVTALQNVLRSLEEEYAWLERDGLTADELTWLSGMIANIKARLAFLDDQVWSIFLNQVDQVTDGGRYDPLQAP
jgi:hypothetical protein